MNAWKLALLVAGAAAAAVADAARTAVVLESSDIRKTHSKFFGLLEGMFAAFVWSRADRDGGDRS